MDPKRPSQSPAVRETAHQESSGAPKPHGEAFQPQESPSAPHAPGETPSLPTPEPVEPGPTGSTAGGGADGVVQDTVESFKSDYPLHGLNVNREFESQEGCTSLLRLGQSHDVATWHTGKTVHLLRLICDMSQTDLAERSGLSTKTISRFEHGGAHDSHTIQAIASAFKIDYRQLVAFDINMLSFGQGDPAAFHAGALPTTPGTHTETDVMKELLWRVFQKLNPQQQYEFLNLMIRAGNDTDIPNKEG